MSVIFFMHYFGMWRPLGTEKQKRLYESSVKSNMLQLIQVVFVDHGRTVLYNPDNLLQKAPCTYQQNLNLKGKFRCFEDCNTDKFGNTDLNDSWPHVMMCNIIIVLFAANRLGLTRSIQGVVIGIDVQLNSFPAQKQEISRTEKLLNYDSIQVEQGIFLPGK